MSTLAEQLTDYYPDDKERSEFAKAIIDDLCNKEYRLYCDMYRIVPSLLIHRNVVIGRKPNVY